MHPPATLGTPFGASLVLAALAAALPARAQVAGTEPGMSRPGTPGALATPSATVRWDHRNQVLLRVGVVEGYRFTVRYHDGTDVDPCNLGDNKFCTGASPFMLDTALGFGVSEGLELDARFRLGLTTDFDDSRPLQLGLGLRSMSGPESRLKLYVAVAGFVDLTSGRLRSGGDLDVVARAEEGLHYDVSRWFGFYVQLGESFSFLRNFSLVVDAGTGVQFRLPP